MIVLTARELQIVKKVCLGHTLVSVATSLGIHHKTVARHMDNARFNNQCTTITQLAVEYTREVMKNPVAKLQQEDLPAGLPKPAFSGDCIMGQRLWTQPQVVQLVAEKELLAQKLLRTHNYIEKVSKQHG